MTKEFLIQLTNNLYRLTLLFPKKEPLRYKMRELANEILAKVRQGKVCRGQTSANLSFENPSSEKLSEEGSVSVFKDLEILDCFFEIAKEQNWVKPADVLAIQKEYANLREELKRGKGEDSLSKATLPLIPAGVLAETVPSEIKNNIVNVKPQQPQPQPQSQPLAPQAMLERQEKILTFLREQGRAQVWQIKQILPEVTKRTLRRDFDSLLKKGMIERIGERNNTFYQIKITQA